MPGAQRLTYIASNVDAERLRCHLAVDASASVVASPRWPKAEELIGFSPEEREKREAVVDPARWASRAAVIAMK